MDQIVAIPTEITENEDQPSQAPALLALFARWDVEEDPEEQQETWEYLKRVLDEDRLSERKLFP